MKIIAATGHRPEKMGVVPADHQLLTIFAARVFQQEKPDLILSGGQRGWDLAVAHAAYLHDVPYWMAIPFDGHHNSWSIDEKNRYEFLVSRAAKSILVSDKYESNCFIKRDHWMVDHCDEVLALWNGIARSGTGATVNYATKLKIPVVNVYNDYLKFLQE